MACTSACCGPKHGTYQVCVTILEAKHLVQNANPMVVVQVGNQKEKTAVVGRTDCPYFNEYFVFDLTCNLETLLSTKIKISVYLRNCLRQLKLHGSIFFEVATVWDQPDHQYYHKWALLTNPKNVASGPKGYVKCNITVNAKGELLKTHPETEGEDDIEGNLLMPIGDSGARQRAVFTFTVYRADGLPTMDGFFRCQNHLENINPYVQISFAGMKGKTSKQHNNFAPQFNERIVFKEMYPPLCHRIRIAIKDHGSACNNIVVAEHILNLRRISNSGENGFLPTFGPSFIHFYGFGRAGECCCTGKCAATLPAHRGRVLISLKTEFADPEASTTPGVEVETTAPVIERSLWKTEEYLLVGIVRDVSMIDRSRFTNKKISFEISLGNAGNRLLSYSQCVESSGDGLLERVTAEKSPEFESQTVPQFTDMKDKKYDYLPYGPSKPCMYVKSWWPNLQWRSSNSNNLRFLANFLESELEKIESLMIVENKTAHVKYNETMQNLTEHCTVYLGMLDSEKYDSDGGTTKLDRLRVNLCRREVEGIMRMIQTNGELPNNNYLRIAMLHAYRYLQKLLDLVDDPQENLPNVFIWMIAGSKRVAYTHLPSTQIMYEETESCRGKNCGRRVNLFMKNPEDHDELQDYSACVAETFLWLGNAKHANACWSAIMPGFEFDYRANVGVFPEYLEYTKFSKFQLRAHIFQGRFDPGSDASGLADPLIRVIFRGHTLQTKTIQQTLDPLWDQTLIFPPQLIYGTREHTKKLPPQVIIEAFDEDMCNTLEFSGRGIATPLVKLNTETYSPPEFPPKLEWHKFVTQKRTNGAVLAAFELIETGEDDIADVPINPTTDFKVYNLPDDIRPKMTNHRMEVIFWGVRDMRKRHFRSVTNPRIIIECAGVYLKSEVMDNAKKFNNFEEPHLMIDLEMPELDIYYPSITIKAFDARGFGLSNYIGVNIIPTVYTLVEHLITEEEYKNDINEHKIIWKLSEKKHHHSAILPLPKHYDPEHEERQGLISYKQIAHPDSSTKFQKVAERIRKTLRFTREFKTQPTTYGNDEDESHDWWSKYYASLQEERNRELGVKRKFLLELEMVHDYGGFQDRLSVYPLMKGKQTGNPIHDEKNVVGKFKGHISIYRWPHEEGKPCRTRTGRDAADGLCDDYPSPEPLKILVRLYVVRGINLQPNDPLTGKSDPYLWVKLGKTIINCHKSYIPNELNPTFGKLFEIDAMFPKDYLLTIKVWDYDATSADDLIGETQIDIENRFYSRHRPSCGIARTYATKGYNLWRDRETPTQILELLCKKNNLPLPEYLENEVKIGRMRFPFNVELDDGSELDTNECKALNVLHHWQEFPICGCALVPEHVEQRPLFNTERPGLEQGKLEMWIDMFPIGDFPPKPPVNITPHAPEEYELRCIIWNTEEVPLVDNQFLTGEKCSDIYVKGWIHYEDCQKTDVHYNSLTGEGNFNWRFLFRFTYLRAEEMMVVRKKMSVLAHDTTEQKIPCKLNLQVWDNDHFSPDDFLGALTIDLAKIQRGSANAKNCTVQLLEPEAPTVSIFKAMRLKSWWPFVSTDKDGTYIPAGKLEMELILVQAEEANESPVGKGRDPPDPMAPPNRPDTSFSWFRNPWKACRFVVCRFYKWKIISCLLILLTLALIGCGVYAFPGYFVKRIMGA